MLRRRSALLLTTAALAGCSAGEQSTQPDGDPSSGTADEVVRVVDGDTVELRDLGTVRLIGIDTPEVFGGRECFGREASAFTKRVLPSGTSVRYRFDAERRDRYDRALVYLFAGGKMINEQIARGGFANQLTIPPNVAYERRFRRAVRAARENGRGLWAANGCGGGDPPRENQAGRDRDCSDFTTQAEAQAYFESRGGPAKDPDNLDSDRDGRVCASLP